MKNTLHVHGIDPGEMDETGVTRFYSEDGRLAATVYPASGGYCLDDETPCAFPQIDWSLT